MDSRYYSDKELDRAKGRINRLYKPIFDQTVSANPLAILLGGQPASGKSGLIDKIIAPRRKKTFAVINGDEYRQYHPRKQEFDKAFGPHAPTYTQPFSNALVEFLKAECLRLHCNFIIEGTMRTSLVIERTANEIRQAGFRVEAHVLAVHRQDSLLGVFQRYERDKQLTGMGRFSPIGVHDEAYRQIPVNLNQADYNNLFDRIVVYTRQPDGQLTIGIDRPANPTEFLDFVAEFERLRQPIYPADFYKTQWLAISELARHRNETDTVYLRQITEFVQQAGR